MSDVAPLDERPRTGASSLAMSATPLGKRLRTPAAADYLGIGKSTLDKMRCHRTGPVFERSGRRAVVYSIPALDEYLAKRRATSTSKSPPQRAEPALGPASPNGAPSRASKVADKPAEPARPARRPTANKGGRGPPRRPK